MMSSKYSEHFQHEIHPDREYHPNSDAASAKIAIKQLAEEISELSDGQSNAIAGGRSRYELSDGQLEAFAGGRVSSVIHIIGFEN
jgi:hypothetical protein